MTARTAALGLAAIAMLAVAVRSLGFESVFIDGDVLLQMWDGSYHARRALYSFVEFPQILFTDPYLSFPDGAPVPMPPLFDWMLAAVARCFGSELGVFERVAAWSSPVLAALALLPTYFLARNVRGRGVGLGAALLLAAIPASTQRSLLGDPDHHAAVTLLLITVLASSAALLRDGLNPRRRRISELLLFSVRTALVLVWSGSLLFVMIGEGGFLLASLLARRRELLVLQARSCALSALVVAPWVWAAPTPLGGPFTATTLSWIHPLALFAIAATVLTLAWLEREKPLASRGGSIARAAGLVVFGCALALCVPAVREAASQGLAFLAKSDTWGMRNYEQTPLFSWKRGAFDVGTAGTFGWWSYGIPLAPFVFLAARSIGLPVRAFLAVWVACLGAGTIGQIRFASDFAPIACVAIAVSLDQFRARLARRIPSALAWLCCVALGVALSWGPIYGNLSEHIEMARRFRTLPDGVDPALHFSSTTMVRFAQTVRAHTPETSGYFDPNARPEYGILVKPSFGHVFIYVARRATPTSGFGPYVDPEKYHATLRFYTVQGAQQALSIVDSLGVRYVVTRAHDKRSRGLFVHLLHRQDGSTEDGAQHSGRFRLIVEGPEGGMPLPWARIRDDEKVVPYKLFERVAGAVLEVRAPPGTPFFAELELETNIGRRFLYRARTTARADGVAQLRVPYATDTGGGTRALGPYRVTIGEENARSVEVRESDVQSGAALELAPDTASAPLLEK